MRYVERFQRSGFVFALIISNLIGTACSDPSAANNSSTVQRMNSNIVAPEDQLTANDIERNRNKWAAKGPEDYQMVVVFKPGGQHIPASRVLINVRKRRAVSIKRLDKEGSKFLDAYEQLNTIEKIFGRLSLDVGDRTQMVGTFDPEMGYPLEVRANSIHGSNAYYELRVERLEQK